jgi:CheY-like chemotaxis protein
MRILLVEDDENKRTKLSIFIRQLVPSADVVAARAYKSGLRAIVSDEFDLILLDMTMTMFDVSVEEDGGRTQAFAGREILRQMQRRGIKMPVIVVTQYDRFGEAADDLTIEQLDSLLRDSHPDIYHGTVYYDAAASGWQDQLATRIIALQENLREEDN